MSKTLLETNWDEFGNFLTIARNHSTKREALSADRSRFKAIQRWFENRRWNRNNFLNLIAYLKKNGRSQSTINKYISMGKCIDEFLGTTEIKSIKSKVERLPRVENTLLPSEIIKLAEIEINYSKYKNYINQRQKALILLLGSIGCRISEVTNLEWRDIKGGNYKVVEFRNTKNGTDRSVPLPRYVFELILDLPRIAKFVFVSAKKKPLNSQVVNLDLKRRAEEAGISKNINTHLFRHSTATILLESGVSEADVCKIMGWSDQRMIMRYKNSDLGYYSDVVIKSPLVAHFDNWQSQAEANLNRMEFLEFVKAIDFQLLEKLTHRLEPQFAALERSLMG